MENKAIGTAHLHYDSHSKRSCTRYILQVQNFTEECPFTLVFQKLEGRKAALKAKTSWDAERKQKVLDALRLEYMSSESDRDSGDESVYIVKTLSWRSDMYQAVVAELDSKATAMKTKRGRKQEVRRVRDGSISNRPMPEHPESHAWILK